MTPAATAPQAADIPVLPGLRQDLQLLPGELQADGVPSWRIHDPVRNRFFDIGWIEFELLQRWREGVTGAELITEVSARPRHKAKRQLESWRLLTGKAPYLLVARGGFEPPTFGL